MSSDPQTELRLSRLENDRDALYELVTDIQQTQQAHTRRFDRVDQRFDGIDGRLDGMDGRFDGIDQRLDGMDRRFDGIDQRLDGIDGTLAEILRRLPEPT